MTKKMPTLKVIGFLCVSMASSNAFCADGWSAKGSLSWGLGKMSSTSVTSRTMNTIVLTALPGYRLSQFTFGLLGEYRLIGQNTEPAEISNSNLKGHALLFGIGGAYDCGDFSFGLNLPLLGKQSSSLADAAGKDVSYQKPFGFELTVGYVVAPMITVDAKFSYTTYAQTTIGSTDKDLSDDKLKATDFAIGGSYHFN